MFFDPLFHSLMAVTPERGNYAKKLNACLILLT
jgi:hypothetical protein